MRDKMSAHRTRNNVTSAQAITVANVVPFIREFATTFAAFGRVVSRWLLGDFDCHRYLAFALGMKSFMLRYAPVSSLK